MYIPNLSVVCFFICLSYFIFYCALLLFCAQAWHGKTLSSRNDPIFFCSLHWRNLSSYNKITTTHFKQIRFWWKNVIKFRGKVYSNFFKFVQQLFFLSVACQWTTALCIKCRSIWKQVMEIYCQSRNQLYWRDVHVDRMRLIAQPFKYIYTHIQHIFWKYFHVYTFIYSYILYYIQIYLIY